MSLIDTDVLSALRRGERHSEAATWLTSQRTIDLYLSAVAIGEIERGIAQQQRRDPPFARNLSAWLDKILTWYDNRVLPVDVPTARRWGTCLAPSATKASTSSLPPLPSNTA